MSGYTTALQAQKAQALIEMMTQDGASPSGQMPGIDYLTALQDAQAIEDVQATVEAHGKGNAPPEVGGGPGGQ